MHEAWYILAGLVHLWLGVCIARLSREVVDNWGDRNEGTAAKTFWARFWLYPVSAFDLLEGKSIINGVVFRDRPIYVVLHVLGWEVRIAVNLLVVLILGLVVGVVVGLIYFAISSLKRAVKD